MLVRSSTFHPSPPLQHCLDARRRARRPKAPPRPVPRPEGPETKPGGPPSGPGARPLEPVMGKPPVTTVGSIPAKPMPRGTPPSTTETPPEAPAGRNRPLPDVVPGRVWSMKTSLRTPRGLERLGSALGHHGTPEGAPWRSHPHTPPFPFGRSLERGSGPRTGAGAPDPKPSRIVHAEAGPSWPALPPPRSLGATEGRPGGCLAGRVGS